MNSKTAIEMIQIETHREKKIETWNRTSWSCGTILQQDNIHVIRVPEKFQEIMAKTFPIWWELQTYRAKKLNEHPKYKKHKRKLH